MSHAHISCIKKDQVPSLNRTFKKLKIICGTYARIQRHNCTLSGRPVHRTHSVRATCGQTEFTSTSSRGSFLRVLELHGNCPRNGDTSSGVASQIERGSFSWWSLRREVHAFSLREVPFATIKLAYGHSGRVCCLGVQQRWSVFTASQAGACNRMGSRCLVPTRSNKLNK